MKYSWSEAPSKTPQSWFVCISIASCARKWGKIPRYPFGLAFYFSLFLNSMFPLVNEWFIWEGNTYHRCHNVFRLKDKLRSYASKNQACLLSAWDMTAEMSMMSRNILLVDSCFLCKWLVRITFFAICRPNSTCTVSSRDIEAAIWYHFLFYQNSSLFWYP